MPTHVLPAKAKNCGCTGDDITFVSLVDFNAPGCRSSGNVEALCERVAMVNNLAPERNCALCILPDVPRDSSLRGLYGRRREEHTREPRDPTEPFFRRNLAMFFSRGWDFHFIVIPGGQEDFDFIILNFFL